MHISSSSRWAVVTAAAVVCFLAADLSATDAAALDHFKCYKAKDLKAPKFEKTSLDSLDDQFVTETDVELKKPFVLCNPVSKNDEGIENAADHLVCYKAKPSKLEPPPKVRVVNQLGTLDLEVKKSFLVCIPSKKTVLPAPSSGEFLALTYNVAGLPEGLSGSHPEANTPIIAPLLNNYDLVLMQETWKTPDPNPLAPTRVYHEILEAASLHPFKSVSAPLPLGTDPERPSALVSDGLNRFSRFRFDDVTRERWTDCHNSAADCLSLKGFSFARTTFPGGTVVDVYNLHMEAGGDPEDEAVRDTGVTQIVDFMAANSAGRPVLLGGDFNLHIEDEPDGTQFARLLADTGLSDVCATLGCSGPNRIDKWLYRSGGGVTLEPLSWRVETDVFIRGDGEPLSDHDAVAVRFAWSVD